MIMKQLRIDFNIKAQLRSLFSYRAFSTQCSNVIKELVHAFSSAYSDLWIHLGSLESTQGARVTLFACSPNFPRASITRYTHAKHEPILNYSEH